MKTIKTPNPARRIANIIEEIRRTCIEDVDVEVMEEILLRELNEVFTYAYDEGRDAGLKEGYTDGQDYGYSEGLKGGYTDGYSEGLKEGYYDGRYADQRPRLP